MFRYFSANQSSYETAGGFSLDDNDNEDEKTKNVSSTKKKKQLIHSLFDDEQGMCFVYL